MIEAVFVTGGAGYIGSATVHHLLNSAGIKKVVVFDDLSLGHKGAVHPKAQLVVGKLEDATAVQKAITQLLEEGGRINPEHVVVVHFAAKTSVPESVAKPLEYWNANVGNTIRLVALMREQGIRRFVFSSTAAVYGDPTGEILSEDHTKAPINPYGHTKFVAEQLLEELATCGDGPQLHARALRYFNACGAMKIVDGHDGMTMLGEDHSPETHMIPNALAAALAQDGAKPFKLFGTNFPTADGSCVRDYIHIEDLASAHLLAIKAVGEEHSEKGSFDSFNVGTGRGISNREIISAIENVTGKRVPLVELPPRPGDPPILIADATKIKRILQWTPQHTEITETIKGVHEWMVRYPRGYGAS